MERVEFYDAAPWGTADKQWQSTNRAMGRLIRLHRKGLDRTKSMAERILRKLESIFPIMEELCRVTCPRCPDPCCIVNKVWIDFQDLILLHLTGQKIPPGQLNTAQYENCRYLKPGGCMLPRNLRPWGCNQYVCSTQIKNLQRSNRLRLNRLDTDIRSIRIERLDMEDAFVLTISQNRKQN